MTKTDVDILVSGGGLAGLMASAAFGNAGFNVLCVDPATPVIERHAETADLRSTALLQPARSLLERVGLWERLAPHATPLEIMRIVDARGAPPAVQVAKDFRASEISDSPFGWNFPNWLLRRELVAHLAELSLVSFQPGVGARAVISDLSQAIVRLSDGRQVRARLCLAADGRHSTLRQMAGIGVNTFRYGQKALAFAVTHPIPHENVSTEIHHLGGPFTLVPLPDYQDRPCSAIVWMEDGRKALDLQNLPEPAFEAAMTERSCHVFGPLTLASRRSVWPIISQRAERLVAGRLALMAEAAHVVPPIGAQGLNMSLRDISVLLDLAERTPDHLGAPEMLEQYEGQRMPDIIARVAGIDALNRVSQAHFPGISDLRPIGLQALHGFPPLRRALMKLGLGAG